MNPLLSLDSLPRFGDLRTEHIGPAIDSLIAQNAATLDTLRADPSPPDWDHFVRPLEDAIERIARAWGQVAHLNAVVNTPEMREAYNANLPKVTTFWAGLAQDAGLFARYRALAEGPTYATLSPAQRRVIDNELRDFRLGGAELPDVDKASYLALQEELAGLAARFDANLIDTTRAWSHHVTDPIQLGGLPPDVVEAAADAAGQEGGSGWKFTLHAPSYLPVMQYGEHRPLREALYRGYATRASEFGNPAWDNGPLIVRLRELRAEQARLLGYPSYAHLSLVPKMAESPEQVLGFLRDLAARARPFAERDMQELRTFAASELGLDALEPWDIGFASEQLRSTRYAYSDQEVRRYLSESQVLDGLFGLIKRLYAVQVFAADAPVWHPDARFYQLRAADGALVGAFYLDLYARDGKRGGAWMDDAITRRRLDGVVQTPVAYLTCNFSPPVGGRPATFTHDEVLTLFHEFGHGLHHLLSRVEHYSVSGIHGVEWDAVELPSQFMENFCWEWDVLAGMTRHVDTGEPLPRAVFERMLAARNFQSGMHTLRQIEFALFDMHLYHDYDPARDGSVLELIGRIRAEVAVVQPPVWHRFPMSFSHVFSGGYAAGYYSYKWAEVLSADAFSLFEERGVLDPPTGRRFLDEILAVGGSRPAMESFRAFRGREPNIDALLRHHGMDAAGS
jgi:oligopeptidase A